MTDINWSDEMGSRSRKAWLLLIKGNEITAFTGNSIPNVVVVAGHDYKKNGKWSHTKYRLSLADGVRAIAGKDGWELGTFAEGLQAATKSGPLDRWTTMAQALGVSEEGLKKFLRGWRPKAAETLDDVEVKLAEITPKVTVVKTYFGFGIADSMFPEGSCDIVRESLSPELVKFVIDEGGVIPCLNPSHKLTIDAMRTRFGINIPIPEKAPVVKLERGDRLLVMGVSGLPRLEGRHEYTAEEIEAAQFRFGSYTIME